MPIVVLLSFELNLVSVFFCQFWLKKNKIGVVIYPLQLVGFLNSPFLVKLLCYSLDAKDVCVEHIFPSAFR